MSDKAAWVKLDLDFTTDDKIADLVVRHGAEGVGVYFMLIAFMSKASGKRLGTHRLTTASHAANMDAERHLAIVDSMLELDLIQGDGNFVWCNTLNRRLEHYDAIVERNRRNGRKNKGRKAKPNPVGTQSPASGNPVVKQSRVEEIRIDKKRENARPHSLKEVEDYFHIMGVPGFQAEAERFYLHYDTQGWEKGSGAAVTDWRGLARKWKLDMPKFAANQKGSTVNGDGTTVQPKPRSTFRKQLTSEEIKKIAERL